MANVFDYLKWRDDIKFDKLNEIDTLIFEHVSYFPLEFLMDKKEKITLKELYERSINKDDLVYYQEDKKLIKVLAESERYKDIKIGNVCYKQDEQKEEQFLGVTIYLPNGNLFISFRGTTLEMYSWKEDFNMCYMITPCQLDALDYLNKVNPLKKLYVAGHSKGGNLAVYASIYAKKRIRKNIIRVLNYEGPGLMELDDNYYAMQDKIINYIPCNSIIGRILYSDAKTVVVKSNYRGIMQHDVYSWEVLKTRFVRGELTRESNAIKGMFDGFLKKYDLEKRKKFVEQIFNLIYSTGAKTTNDLNYKVIFKTITGYKKIDEESKKFLIEIMKYFAVSAKDNVKKEFIGDKKNGSSK